MAVKKKKRISIKPQFVKNAQGKTEQVFLDIKTYNNILDEIQKFSKIKKKTCKQKQENTKKL